MYVPAVDAAISISPVEVFILNPVVELNVPPVVPVMVGVGLASPSQKLLVANAKDGSELCSKVKLR